MRKIFSLIATSTTTAPPVCPPQLARGSVLLTGLPGPSWSSTTFVATGLRDAPRLCLRIGYRGLAALLLGYPRHHGERSLAGPTAGLRRCLSADAGQRLLPARVAERPHSLPHLSRRRCTDNRAECRRRGVGR